MQYRIVDAAGLRPIANVLRRLTLGPGSNFSRKLRRIECEPNVIAVAALATPMGQQDPIGWALWWPDDNINLGCYVEAPHRRHGIATTLLDHLRPHWRAAGPTLPMVRCGGDDLASAFWGRFPGEVAIEQPERIAYPYDTTPNMDPKRPTLPPGYRFLTVGERRHLGDLAWTWMTPDCNVLGWTRVMQQGIIDDGHVPTIRKTT